MDQRLIEAPYPMQSHLGFKMHLWEEDHAIFHLPLEPFLMNRYGIPHGGVHAVLLDTVMGFAGCYTGDPDHRRFAMTLSMNVNFLGRPEGKLLIGEARRTGGGKTIYFAEGSVADESGNLVATGTGTFRYNNSPFASKRS